MWAGADALQKLPGGLEVPAFPLRQLRLRRHQLAAKGLGQDRLGQPVCSRRRVRRSRFNLVRESKECLNSLNDLVLFHSRREWNRRLTQYFNVDVLLSRRWGEVRQIGARRADEELHIRIVRESWHN